MPNALHPYRDKMHYPKIETLYDRDKKKFVDERCARFEEVKQIKEWLVTEKIHGMNIRVEYTKDRTLIDGRYENSEIPKELAILLEQTFTTVDAMMRFDNAFPYVKNPKPVKEGEAPQPDAVVTLFGEGFGKPVKSETKYPAYYSKEIGKNRGGKMKTESGQKSKMKMKIELEPVSKKEVKIMGVFLNGSVRKEIGHIFTPAGTSENIKDAIQVCGFSRANDYWGCGMYGQLASVRKEKVKGHKGFFDDFEVEHKTFNQVRDILLQFDPRTVRHTVDDPSGKCCRCFNKPCTCEVKKQGTNPYTVKRSIKGDCTVTVRKSKSKCQK